MARMLHVNESVGSQAPLRAVCGCSYGDRPRRLPVWRQVQNCEAVGRMVNGILQEDVVLFTYRCSKCSRKVAITVGDLFQHDP